MPERKFLVDSSEKPYVFQALDLMGIDYEITEIKLYFCDECDKIYKEKPDECECGCNKIKYERVADIVVEEDGEWIAAIERKKGNDLIASLDDRIYAQMEGLSKYFNGNIAIVFEGNFNETIQEAEKRSWQVRSIPFTCLQYGVSFIVVKDIVDTIKMLRFLFEKANNPPKLRTKRHHYHDLLPKNQLMFMAIFKCGLKLSLILAKKYPSITDFGIDIRKRGFKEVAKGLVGIGEKRVRQYADWVI